MEPISQKGERKSFDIIILGSGIAGLSFALSANHLYPNASIAIISKKTLSDSNSYYAQGGIAAVASPNDSIQQHIEDTLQAGDGLCENEAVNMIINSGPEAIHFLQDYNIQFDQSGSEPSLAQEGGHSQRRIYHCGDCTGSNIIRNLIQAVQKISQITLCEYHTAVNLITQNKVHQPGSQPEVIGAYILDEKQGLIHTFTSKITVLATGGAGKVYRYTTNPDVATGDGIAMAYRAGARIGNMEFYQFHPTLLFHQKNNNFLISEALRGEGAYLRRVDNGQRFMQHYAPDKMELATRDIVARAIFNEIENSAYNYVYLDIRHQPKAFLQQHFPSIYNTLFSLGIDISKDMIPVVPAAHYLCGGVLADTQGQTDLKRLYAIGETAFTGLHGANRLASNSLLESIVMARLAANSCQTWLSSEPKIYEAIPDWNSQSVVNPRRASQINAHWRGLRGEMTSYAGIVRTEEGLNDLLKLIQARSTMIEEYYWKHSVTRDFIELRNIVLVAELIVRSAINRRETRGGHFREDYPNKIEKFTEQLQETKYFSEQQQIIKNEKASLC